MPKYSLYIPRQVESLLEQEASIGECHSGEILRRAISTYVYLKREERRGYRVSITNEKEILKDVILP